MYNVKYRYILLAIIPCFIWANSYIFQRLVLRIISPYTLLCLETIFILPVTLIYFFMYGRVKARFVDIMLSSIFWFLTYSSVLQASKTGIYAGTASIIGKTNILISLFISIVFMKEKVQSQSMIAIIVGIIGLLFIFGIPNVHQNLSGFLWMLSFAFFWSIYMAFTKIKTNRNAESLKDVIYNTLIISNFTIPMSFISSFLFERNEWDRMYNIEMIHIFYIFVLSICGIVVALSLWHYVNTKYPFHKVTLFCLATPLITMIEGVFVLRERIHCFQIIGMFSVILSFFLINSNNLSSFLDRLCRYKNNILKLNK